MIDAVEGLIRRWPALAPMHRRLIGPLDIGVVGSTGSGRATLCRALHNSTSCSAVVFDAASDAGNPQTDPDMWVYVLVGGFRAGDREQLALLPADRTVVVANKVDVMSATRGLPVSALWGSVTVTSDDAALIGEIAALDTPIPRRSAEFATDDRRTGLLRRMDRAGIIACAAEVTAGRLAGNPDELQRFLRRRSGLSELGAEFVRRRGRIEDFRRRRATADLDLVAATSPGRLRDAIESVLVR